MSASNPRTRLMRMRQDVLREMIDGESYSKLAYKYKTSKPLLMSVMREYRAYKHWLLARKQDSMLMDQEIRQYLDNGMTVANLAELYWVSYDTMRTRVNEIEKTTKNEYLGPVDRAETKRYVTVDDVKEFKIRVQVGELLICDETEDGVLIYCKILKKHLWYADTDMGSVDWNWLCVKNMRRLFDNEIIYG